jgi:hypothetical protein
VVVKIDKTSRETSLFPKDGGDLVPIKASVRKVERLEPGDWVKVALAAGVNH